MLYHCRPWLSRVNYAIQLLELAGRLTGSTPYRLYLTDPSADNFAVRDLSNTDILDNDTLSDVIDVTKEQLTLIDGEGVIIADVSSIKHGKSIY